MPRSRHVARSSLVSAAAAAFLSALPIGTAIGQRLPAADTAGVQRPAVLSTIGSVADERGRTRQLRDAQLDGFAFRSASSMTAALAGAPDRVQVGVILPHIRTTYNSELPYSLNDGALWAGRGMNVSVVAGIIVEYGRFRLIAAPELSASQNRPYELADPAISPSVPPSRNPFSSPWHAGAQSIDLPIRFGDAPLSRAGGGQSSLTMDAGPVTVGVATENEWWGPGIRNALLLSDNAAGFAHALVRTTRPLDTPAGRLEGRWLAGALIESPFFDTDPSNDRRSISMLGLSLQPRGAPNVVVGVARAVYAASDGIAPALLTFPQVFRSVGQPNAVPATDSSRPRSPDALMSVFARWVPASGLELYAEWARAEQPRSLRDFLEQPTHSQAYTAGLQWLGAPVARTRGRFRVQLEGTTVEQSTTYRFRPIGSWYTSHAVEQGYTERGQTLGAAIGPGSSSQWFAIDHVAPRWELGGYLTRVRWMLDAQSQIRYGSDIGYCGQDVSLLPGVRGSASTRFGTVTADYSSGWRLNVFFEQRGECFRTVSRDQHNKSLTLTFVPPPRWRW